MSYTRITGSKDGIEASLLSRSTEDLGRGAEADLAEYFCQSEKNSNDSSFAEWCLWNAMDDMTNFQRNFSTGEVEIHRSASSSTRQNTENAAITMLYML